MTETQHSYHTNYFISEPKEKLIEHCRDEIYGEDIIRYFSGNKLYFFTKLKPYGKKSKQHFIFVESDSGYHVCCVIKPDKKPYELLIAKIFSISSFDCFSINTSLSSHLFWFIVAFMNSVENIYNSLNDLYNTRYFKDLTQEDLKIFAILHEISK